MRYFAVIGWAVILGVLTCDLSLNGLFYRQAIHFSINPHPDFFELFKLDLRFVHSHWTIIKLGHFIGFAIMDALLWNMTRKRGASALLSIAFAVSTEILQLYFNRDGRIYDMLIDSAGVLASYYIPLIHRMVFGNYAKSFHK
ncbi:VanZ family protein [Paenibacillus cremeus]|nr:VanZ family protein [Paenibacillus cremeus]